VVIGPAVGAEKAWVTVLMHEIMKAASMQVVLMMLTHMSGSPTKVTLPAATPVRTRKPIFNHIEVFGSIPFCITPLLK
jgi:hypothetical protein